MRNVKGARTVVEPSSASASTRQEVLHEQIR